MSKESGGILLSDPGTYNYLLLVLLLLFLLLVSLYVLRWKKKRLNAIIDHKVEVFEKAFDISEDAILILSNENKVVYANRSMIKLLGLSEDYRGKDLVHMPQIRNHETLLPLDIFVNQEYRGDKTQMQTYPQSFLVLDEAEEEIPVNLYLDSSEGRYSGESWCKIIYMHDLRKEIKHETVSRRHQLTQLPNQAQLQIDLNALFAKNHLDKKKLALVLIDIDNFTMLRSIIGHEQANKILIKFAEYLMHLPTSLNFKVYHTHHNNFLLTISNLEEVDEVTSLIREIQKELTMFYKIEDVRLYLTASVGIAIYPDSATRRTLLDRTYQALATAQKQGYGKCEVYMPEAIRQDYDELLLFNEMHEALEKEEFEVYYQPIVTTSEQEVVGAEALIRWNHPKYGLIPPTVFIPIMEKTGFIIELGEYILEEVLKQMKRWELFKFKEIQISINVTLLELERKGFAEYVSKQLLHHQINPERLKFEITEGYAMRSERLTRQEIWSLKKLGVSIALDDFGTGYTSFAYLKKFPADIVKIDKTMVDYILTNKEDQRIVKAMIDLGHNLGMKIIVEGIENKRMFDLIASYGCDYIQGYYISKPLPVFEFQKLLR